MSVVESMGLVASLLGVNPAYAPVMVPDEIY